MTAATPDGHTFSPSSPPQNLGFLRSVAVNCGHCAVDVREGYSGNLGLLLPFGSSGHVMEGTSPLCFLCSRKNDEDM